MNGDLDMPLLDRALQDTRAGEYLRGIEGLESCLGLADTALPESRTTMLRSYYGVCVAMVWGRTDEPLRWCRAAVEQDAGDPDLLHNLALVLLRAGRRDEALRWLQQGQSLDPQHRGIQATFQHLTPRRRPLFVSLGRSHPLNRTWGRFRSRVLGA